MARNIRAMFSKMGGQARAGARGASRRLSTNPMFKRSSMAMGEMGQSARTMGSKIAGSPMGQAASRMGQQFAGSKVGRVGQTAGGAAMSAGKLGMAYSKLGAMKAGSMMMARPGVAAVGGAAGLAAMMAGRKMMKNRKQKKAMRGGFTPVRRV